MKQYTKTWKKKVLKDKETLLSPAICRRYWFGLGRELGAFRGPIKIDEEIGEALSNEGRVYLR